MTCRTARSSAKIAWKNGPKIIERRPVGISPMKNFDKGVSWYATGTVTVPIGFPEGDICCKWCKLFLRYEDAFKRYSCRLTEEWIIDPAHGIGQRCPLVFEEGLIDGEHGDL